MYWRVALVASVFAGLFWLGWYRTAPIISGDETGFLGLARFIATGEGTNQGTTTPMSFGVSMLFSLGYLFSASQEGVYRFCMAVNALSVALSIPLLVAIGRGLLPDARWLWPASTVIMLWPQSVYDVYFAWSESVFTLLFLCSVYLVQRIQCRGTWASALALVIVGAVLCATHSRGLLAPFIVGALLPAIWRSRYAYVASAGSVLAFFAVNLAQGHFTQALWMWQSGTGTRVTEMLHSALAEPMLFFNIAVGQLWYQATTTLGLAILGLFVLLHRIVEQRDWTAVFVVAVTGSVFAASVASLGTNFFRFDHLVYGRYVSAVAPLFMLVGFAYAQHNRFALAAVAGTTVVATVYMVWVAEPFETGPITMHVIPDLILPSVVGIEFGLDRLTRVFMLSTAAVIVAAILGLVYWRAFVVLALVLAPLSNYFALQFIWRADAGAEQRTQADLIALEPARGQQIYWHATARRGQTFLTQYALDNGPFVHVSTRALEELPPGAPVLVHESFEVEGFELISDLNSGVKLYRKL